MQRGNLQPIGDDSDNSTMDNRIPTNALARAQIPIGSQLQSLREAASESKQQEHQLRQHRQQEHQRQHQSAVASYLAGARQTSPRAPSLLFQQQNAQMMNPGGLFAGVGTDPATAFLRRQEDQLLATRFLLQQQQLDEFLSSGAGVAGARPGAAGGVNPLLLQQLLGNPTPHRGSLEHLHADLLASRGGLSLGALSSKAPEPSDRSSLLKPAANDGKGSAGDLGRLDRSLPKPDRSSDSSSSDDEKDEALKTAPEDTENDAGDPKNPQVAGATENFPLKLYRILEEVEKDKKDDIISFLSHGRAFAIHKPRQFVSEIMPKYFTTSRMSSFQRQLNLYGFRRITEGRDKGGYFHDNFLKGKKKLCKKIKRKKTNVKPPPNLFGGVGLPEAVSNLSAYTPNHDMLLRHSLAGGGRMNLNPGASIGHGLLSGSSMLGGGGRWSGLSPTASSQASTNQAVAAYLEQQQAQHAANNQLLLQQLQHQQILEELERRRRESGGS